VAASRDAQVTAIEADLADAATKAPFAEVVARLAAYRGVGQLGALALAAEVGDWRRFAHAAGFMAFTGLVPCERSSADSVWRGHITRTGSKHLRFQLGSSSVGPEGILVETGIGPATAVPRRVVTIMALLGGRSAQAVGQAVMSAHRNPASSRAIAVATMLVEDLPTPSRRNRPHSRSWAAQARATTEASAEQQAPPDR
jgi:hypothetical protein